jgi:glutamine amidotransferase-like uncharacterized protein
VANPDSDGVVALYDDNGAFEHSVTALGHMIRWMGLDVTVVDAEKIGRGALDGFDLLCVPGGDMYEYSQSLGSTGIQKIREFVENGGGYVGICGGAYFAGERVYWRGNQLPMTSLSLFEGETRGPYDEIVPYPGYGMAQVQIVGGEHPIVQGEPRSIMILYYWGPALLPDEDTSVVVLGRYATTQDPAMLALEYGQGRVFLIGTHPEFEEDDTRDGTDFADDLEDEGTDWNLLRRAVDWCMQAVE